MPQRRKSIAEHRLLGNYRPDRHHDPAPAPTIPQGRPPYPSHLSPAAKREYKRICGLLEQRGHLTPGDYYVAGALATVLARWITAKQELDAAGSLLLTVTWTD